MNYHLLVDEIKMIIILASMVAFAERRMTSIYRVPPAKREAVVEALEGAMDALLSSASAPTTTSGMTDATVAKNCANKERWTLDNFMRAKVRSRARQKRGRE